VHALNVDIPAGRLTAVTGVSGSSKTTLILESLVPALKATATGGPLPRHVTAVDAPGITRVSMVDEREHPMNLIEFTVRVGRRWGVAKGRRAQVCWRGTPTRTPF
jgi:RecA/RadA recombinase